MRKGFSFGLTSGIITTLGMIVGLHSGTNSTPIVIGGIALIAFADAFSDAMGMHISEESEIKHSTREIWEATMATFFSKFIFASTFIIPFVLFSPQAAIVISVIWVFSLITIFSFYIARQQNLRPSRVILEHLIISTAVVVITDYVGSWIANFG